jgi:hypothetical protein
MANKPVLHRRDHEHGGADPVRIVWESTGAGGGGAAGALPTIKARALLEAVSNTFWIGSVENEDDGAWEYLYALEHPSLLYIDPTTNLVTRDGFDFGSEQGSVYLVTYSCGLQNHDGTYTEIQGSAADDFNELYDDAAVRALHSTNRLAYVKCLGPPDRLRIDHDAVSLVPTGSATMSVTLLNPGPVPL